MSSAAKRGVALASVAVAVLACAGQARIANVFSTDWQDDGGRSIAAIEARLRERSAPKGANVAVGVVQDGLVGVVLDDGSKWKFSHAVDARPWIAGDMVVGTGGGEVFAIDARTGQAVWTRPATGKIRGAGDDGTTTMVSLEPSGQRGGGLLAIARDGRVVRQLEADVALGNPAIVTNLAFIPWANQYVTVFDLGAGEEVARVTLRQQTSHAFVAGGALYFGEIGVTRFDEKIGGASRSQANHVGLPARELPGKPRWMRPGGFVLERTADAFDRIAAYGRPSFGDGRLALDANRYYATYYRIAVGLDAVSGELAWVRPLADDAIAGAAYEGGLVLCTASGKVTMLDARGGAESGAVELGQPVLSCVVQADSLTRPSGAGAPGPLVDQLAGAILLNDTELATMQRFLLRELIGQESDIATKTLIEIAANGETSPVLLDDARAGLAARRNGADYMLESLARHYDYLQDVLRSPPVGPLADALAAMGEKRAAPPLAEHLNDPANSSDDIKRAARALGVLATDKEQPALENFFNLYRATADSDDLVEAVVDVARALQRIGGAQGRRLVSEAAADPLTVPALKEPLSNLSRSSAPASAKAPAPAASP